MNRRERIISSINHQETDYIPCHTEYTRQEYQKLVEAIGENTLIEMTSNHMDKLSWDGSHKELTPGSGYFMDNFGVVWNRNGADKDIGVIDGYVIKGPGLQDYKFPELNVRELRNSIEKIVERSPDKFKVVSIGFSLFERAWTLRGMENLLMDMVDEPESVHELLGAIVNYNLKVIDIALEYPVDGIMFGDDWGQQKGLIMGPVYWRRFIKPQLSKMYSHIKSSGRYVLQHSCGDLKEILPDLIEIGLDVYQTVQPEIYDLQEIKSKYGRQLTFWGAISTQRLLPYASAEAVREVTEKTLSVMGKGGGYIAGPTHDVPGDVPVENIIAMLDVFRSNL
jgi:uroporphyrinogen decarboxylase